MARHKATQTQRLFPLFRTNDQSSSNSSAVEAASAGSGSRSVVPNSGKAASFFEPTGAGVARDAGGARGAAQGAALVVGAKYLLTHFFGVAIGLGVVTARAPALGAELTLLAVLR